MKIYVENLIDCLSEKIISIQEVESAMHALLVKQAMIFMKRRQDELKHESTARRRQARALSGNCTHQEGTSSDDELPSADMTDFQKSRGDILQDRKKIFEDVHDDFCNIQNILLKFQQWREKFPDSYYEAFVSLCIPKLLNPLIRFQLIDWNPLKSCKSRLCVTSRAVQCSQDKNQAYPWESGRINYNLDNFIYKFDSIGLKQMPWFTSIGEFMESSMKDAGKEDSSDRKILSAVINKIVIPRLTDFVEFIWDPLSTSQTRSLITQCRTILEEHSTCENEVSKGKQVIISRIMNFLIYL
ncbi:GC-rich sequence DNA-binding factor 2 [Camelus dromedarius]|uniref:GC-rich sequence DNA-binding factor 2 n=1 Tax=Camelus dromedarius TaxID=9838 RepID=A0A5N4CD56_CAMDR|nr:GC-rich sequence DNA-binding factor 2 [Camelus dromedarius]